MASYFGFWGCCFQCFASDPSTVQNVFVVFCHRENRIRGVVQFGPSSLVGTEYMVDNIDPGSGGQDSLLSNRDNAGGLTLRRAPGLVARSKRNEDLRCW